MNVEQWVNDLDSIDRTNEVFSDLTNGQVLFKEMYNTDGDQGRNTYNFASKNDPDLQSVLALALKYTILRRDIGFSTYDTGEGGTVSYANCSLDSIENEETESSLIMTVKTIQTGSLSVLIKKTLDAC